MREFPKGSTSTGHVLRNVAISSWFRWEERGSPVAYQCRVHSEQELRDYCSSHTNTTHALG